MFWRNLAGGSSQTGSQRLPIRRAFAMARATTMMFAAITANNDKKGWRRPYAPSRLSLIFERFFRKVEPILLNTPRLTTAG
jgi:hypothetical protein